MKREKPPLRHGGRVDPNKADKLGIRMPDQHGSAEDKNKYASTDLLEMSDGDLFLAKNEAEVGLKYARRGRSQSYWRNRLQQIENALKKKAPLVSE